jgi:hypothetical protein
MCYRDRTYCAGPCATAECSRQITDEVTDAANRAGLPLAVSDLRDTCPKYRPAPETGPENGGK